MTLKEKILYHQIVPAKLLSDIGSSILSLYFFWVHQLITGIVLTFAPSIIASILVLKLCNLDHYADSNQGRYIKIYMTRKAELIRSAGAVIMAVSAWFHIFAGLLIGLILILSAWFYGLFYTKADI